MAAKKQTKTRKKREFKNVGSGVAHIHASFNNTIVTMTDNQGTTYRLGFGGQPRIQGFEEVDAVRRADGRRSRRAQSDGARHEVDRSATSRVPGAGREAAIRSLQAAGLEITLIKDVTPIPHNGCRPPKRRRV